jgi:PAS domain S-box-containing protein
MTKEESREDGALQNGDRDLADTIIDSLPGLFYMFDEQGRFLRWNKNLEVVSGYSAEEIAGMTALDFFTEEGAEICLAATRIVFEEGENTMDNDLRTKDGRLIPHRFSGARRLINGKPCLVGLSLDITERKRAEEAVQRSQAMLAEAQAIAHVGSWEWDVQTGNVEWSEEVYRIFGLDPKQFTPEIDSILALSPPEERNRGQELLARVIETGEVGSYEQRFRRPDGSFGTYISTFAGRYDDDGNLIRMVGVAHDITERKRAEEKLRESERRFRSLVEQAADAFFLSDPRDGQILDVNRQACESLGYSREELLSMKLADVDIDVEPNQHKEQFWDTLEPGHPVTIKGTQRRKDGSTFPVEVRCDVLVIGGRRCLSGLARDVTERRRAEEEREALIQQLESQNAELEQFTYTVSHDLKSPLITIKGFLGVMADDLRQGDMDAAQDGFRRIARAADKMDELLKDLLELSRVGRIVNHSADVPLVQLAEDAMEIVRGQIEQKGVCVRIASDLPVAHGDPARLLEVLQNLIDNAVKYMGDVADPRIEIGSRREGKETVCYVRDNGIGIDPSHLDRVFELFQQLDPNVEGSGIGLALVKRIVELHGGRVWFESEGAGRGATCCFSLPDAQEYAS